MADKEPENENPIEAIRARAMQLFPDDAEERDDYVEARMRRAGYKKGPGEWLSLDDDDDDDGDHDDDDTPVTRADIRKMNRENKRRAAAKVATPPKVEKTNPPSKKKGAEAWW